MTKITDKEFVTLFTHGDVGIDIDKLSDQTEAVLKQAGVDLSELDRNKDGTIRGKEELKELFKVVDGFDVTGSNKDRSFNITDRNNLPTISGLVTESLVEEFNRNAANARIKGPLPKGTSNNDTITTWYGDKENSLVRKDGYLEFKINKKEDQTFPEHIKLAHGKEMSVKKVNEEFIDMQGGGVKKHVLELKYGKEKMYAMIDNQGYMKLWQPHTNTHNAAQATLGGKMLDNLNTLNKTQAEMVQIFRETHQIANGKYELRVDPAVQKSIDEVKAYSMMGKVKEEAAALNKEVMAEKQSLAQGAERLSGYAKKLGPLMERGEIEVSKDADGFSQVALKRPPGMSNDEWGKIQTEFGDKVKNFEKELRSQESDIKLWQTLRNNKAAKLYEKLNDPAMTKYFELLPQPKRLQEFNQIASSLAGTPSGEQMASDLFGTDGSRKSVDPNGVLKPNSKLGETVLKNVYDSPESQNALKGLVLAYANDLHTQPLDYEEFRRERMLEIAMGKQLTKEEKEAARAFGSVASPKELKELMTPEGAEKHGVKYGVIIELMGKLGGFEHAQAAAEAKKAAANAADAAHGSTHGKPSGPFSKAVLAGASLFSALELQGSVRHFLEHPDLGNGLHAAESTARSMHVWGETLEAFGKDSWLARHAKSTGVAAASLALVMDIAKDPKSPEGQRANDIDVLADVAVLGGTIASGPIGVGAAAVGLLVKIFNSGPSEAYDQTYGDLKGAFNIY